MHAVEPHFQFSPNTYATLTPPLKDKFFKKQASSSLTKMAEIEIMLKTRGKSRLKRITRELKSLDFAAHISSNADIDLL